ncbi:uncharacterized protein LOC117571671 [Drosophila albomicans]|uniref:Uncharacterized protein LOC117571671 n=1 Tax=Drosophila albomicans TaxID=7291 RepID=A0A6P8X129_DROAB|nr:uncharacterized protein LOC117571671 [Drosophila albomicans]
MNKLVFLACLAVAAARPDLSRQAYRYEVGQNDNVVTTSYQPTASGTTYFSSSGPTVGQLSSGGGGSNGVFYSSGGSSDGIAYTSGGSNSGGGGGVSYTTGGSNNGGGVSYTSGGSNNGAGVSYTTGGSSNFGSYSTGGVVNDVIGLTGIHPGPEINYKEQEAYISHLANFQPAQVTKHFYLHTAPEDHDEQQIVRYVNVGRPQKNYRVVFINAPASTTSKAKIIANIAPVEEKTAVYVLSKKSNALDVSAEVVTQRPVNNKPEVYFIKYKTPEEAAHAQQTIQANYDALGGSSQTSDEGIVPVSSVINSLGDNGASGVLSDANGAVNIVGTGGVPVVESGASNLQLDVTGSSSNTQSSATQIGGGVSSGSLVGNNVIQTTYLPAKPIRSVKY